MGQIVVGHDGSDCSKVALDEAVRLAKDLGDGVVIDAEVEMVAKRGPEALVDVAERRDARTIVVGSYGEAPLKGMILGSTPHKLLHLTRRPVLVVPANG